MILLATTPAVGHADPSVEKLIEATQIETNRIYEAAKPSELARAFDAVLRKPHARDALIYLFQHAKTDAGRIYALAGLHSVDTNEYHVRVAQVPADNTAKAMWYDVVRILPVKDLVKMIESGALEQILRSQ